MPTSSLRPNKAKPISSAHDEHVPVRRDRLSRPPGRPAPTLLPLRRSAHLRFRSRQRAGFRSHRSFGRANRRPRLLFGFFFALGRRGNGFTRFHCRNRQTFRRRFGAWFDRNRLLHGRRFGTATAAATAGTASAPWLPLPPRPLALYCLPLLKPALHKGLRPPWFRWRARWVVPPVPLWPALPRGSGDRRRTSSTASGGQAPLFPSAPARR